MIAHLSGQVIDIRESSLVIGVNGVGYETFVPSHILASAQIYQETALWIATIVRETSIELFGFASQDEHELFLKLTTVSGVGPRSALNTLNLAPAETLIAGIQSKDTALLGKVSGIGKKTAEKIVLELHDKLDHISVGEKSTLSGDSDVIDALLALGYSQAQAREALNTIDNTTTDTNERIREALRFLG